MWPHLPSVLPHDQEEFVDTALEETRGPDRLPYEYPDFFFLVIPCGSLSLEATPTQGISVL